MSRPFLLLAGALGLAALPAYAAELETGASVRVRGEAYDGRPVGVGPGDEDYVLWRALANGRLAFDNGVEAFVELGWHDQTGRDRGPAPTDENDLDLHQAYLEAPLGEAARLRLGRQELALGSGRLVSLRDGPNIRRAFDLGLVDWRDGLWRVRGFGGRTVEIDAGRFDDAPEDDEAFFGLYAARARKQTGFDLYALAIERADARFAAGVADERRLSLGARVFGASGGADYNFEAVWQTGEFGADDIRAWTIASDVGFTFNAPLSPRLGLKANITSGDGDANDGRLETFNPLYPNLSYFNDAALLSPQNHTDLQPSISVELSDRVSASLGADVFWKTERADAIYRGPGIPVGGATDGRFVATQLDAQISWTPRNDLELRASAVRLDAGGALTASGGEDTTFGMLSLTFRTPSAK